VAGVASSNNPTVVTTDENIFAISDIVQISGSNNNDGIYEFESNVGNTTVQVLVQ